MIQRPRFPQPPSEPRQTSPFIMLGLFLAVLLILPAVAALAPALIDLGEPPGVGPRSVTGKAMASVGITLIAGAVAFFLVVLPRDGRTEHRPILSMIAALGAGVHLIGLLFFGWAEWAPLPLTLGEYLFETIAGIGILLRIGTGLLMLAGAIYLHRAREPSATVWGIMVVPLLVAYLLFGYFSHAADADDIPWLGIIADVAHLGAIGAWIGGLVVLVVILRKLQKDASAGDDFLKHVSTRFSNMAFVSVIFVVASGFYMSWVIIGIGPREATDDPYVQLLGLKILFAFVIVALGGLSKFLHVRKIAKGDPKGMKGFRTNVVREIFFAIIVFGLSAFITNMVPPVA